MAKPVAAFCSGMIGDPRPAQDTTANPRGTQKQFTDLGVVGWFLGGQKSTRAGQIFV